MRSAQAESSATPEDVVRLIDRWDRFRMKLLAFMARYDVMLAPAHAEQAIPHGTLRERFSGFSYTMTYSLAGWPAAVVRVGSAQDGLPIGVQVIGTPWREDVVLAVARHLEQAFGGWRPPPL